MKQITKRLLKGEDLKTSIIQIAKKEKIQAGVILCSVGSLSKIHLRMAGADTTRTYTGEFELISLNGRIAKNGSHIHVHLSFSDKQGKVSGGHLMEGCVVRTTLELVLLSFDDIIYVAKEDPRTGFKELYLKYPIK